MAVKLLAGEPHENESAKAIQACNDYLRLGPGRSLRKLEKKYSKTRRNTAPTTSLDTITHWSADFGWQARANEYDAELEDAKNEQRRKSMEAGLALDFERVKKLKKLASLLEKMIYKTDEFDNHPNVWVADVKQIGSGEYAERVDLVRFNSALISEYRSTLADLAAESGGRKQKMEHEHSGQIPIVILPEGAVDDLL